MFSMQLGKSMVNKYVNILKITNIWDKVIKHNRDNFNLSKYV